MSRRSFIALTLKIGTAGLLVPEWLLDPPKGRSMVAVQGTPGWVRSQLRSAVDDVDARLSLNEIARLFALPPRVVAYLESAYLKPPVS